MASQDHINTTHRKSDHENLKRLAERLTNVTGFTVSLSDALRFAIRAGSEKLDAHDNTSGES